MTEINVVSLSCLDKYLFIYIIKCHLISLVFLFLNISCWKSSVTSERGTNICVWSKQLVLQILALLYLICYAHNVDWLVTINQLVILIGSDPCCCYCSFGGLMWQKKYFPCLRIYEKILQNYFGLVFFSIFIFNLTGSASCRHVSWRRPITEHYRITKTWWLCYQPIKISLQWSMKVRRCNFVQSLSFLTKRNK